SELKSTLGTIITNLHKLYYLEIINFFEKRSTNAASESFNAKIKNFRAQFRGVKDKAFFLYRLTKIYA
uniref:transposase n=1 Tax=Phocaeicola plebeius TaxID=310297 RepID=UPI0026E96C0E